MAIDPVTTDRKWPDAKALAAVIARSPIVVRFRNAPPRAVRPSHLPAGFEAVDVAILDWIAAEARRFGPSFARF